jgi:L-ascorbate metabolism protein UlaG (beta-lactamase superfamily)
MKSALSALYAILVAWLGVAGPPAAEPSRTRLTGYGHSAFRLVTPAHHVVLIDPWITNPSNPRGKQDLADLKDVDLILISHGHADHVGDTLEILRRTHARLMTSFDQAQAYLRYLGFPSTGWTTTRWETSAGHSASSMAR